VTLTVAAWRHVSKGEERNEACQEQPCEGLNSSALVCLLFNLRKAFEIRLSRFGRDDIVKMQFSAANSHEFPRKA
jgi:hypothetical protein